MSSLLPLWHSDAIYNIHKNTEIKTPTPLSVLRQFMVLCWSTCRATLGHIRFWGSSWVGQAWERQKQGSRKKARRAAGQTKAVRGNGETVRWAQTCSQILKCSNLWERQVQDKLVEILQWVMNLWNGLSPRGGPSWQCKWISESFGPTCEWRQ